MKIDSTYLYHVVKLVALISKRGAPNFATLVDQIHREQFTLAARIAPRFDWRFTDYANFDHPSKMIISYKMEVFSLIIFKNLQKTSSIRNINVSTQFSGG